MVIRTMREYDKKNESRRWQDGRSRGEMIGHGGLKKDRSKF
jgi:hypothetical protein